MRRELVTEVRQFKDQPQSPQSAWLPLDSEGQSVAEQMGTHLKAARYSASPMGGSRPPVKAMLTLKPTPGPVPTCGHKERNLSVTL